jgi:hypothetical protein
MIKVCCVCGLVKGSEDSWTDQKLSQEKQLALSQAGEKLSHGYCPKCLLEASGQISPTTAKRLREEAGITEEVSS